MHFCTLYFFHLRNLKVKNPDKYSWDPKWLLSHLIDIYLHLDSEALVSALANDQVRYDALLLLYCYDILFLNFPAIFQTGDIPRHRGEDGERAGQNQHGRGEVRGEVFALTC